MYFSYYTSAGRSEPDRCSSPILYRVQSHNSVREIGWFKVTLNVTGKLERFWGYLCSSLQRTLSCCSSICFFLWEVTLSPKYACWPSPSDSDGISNLKAVDTLISESEGFNLLLEPLPKKIIFPLWNGTDIHCELTSINLRLLLQKADEVWFYISAVSQSKLWQEFDL